MKKELRLYNLILPIWLLFLFPVTWLIVIPGNLIIDCGVLLLALAYLKHTGKTAVVKQLWWKFWLLGFAADFIGVAWLMLGLVPAIEWPGFGPVEWWSESVGYVLGNCFEHWASLLWMIAAVALAGVCIYFFDRRAMRKCDLLTHRERRVIALFMAIITAPWTFFIPMY